MILPTVEWTDACREVAGQLGADDELLVVHDEPADPVADRAGETPDGVRLIAAGAPETCSGKANAIVTGMERARNDLLVWTDDDFHHPPDWLETMVADYRDHGPTTEVPVFVGGDPLSWLLEPAFQLLGTIGVTAETYAWGGAVIFGRDDIDEAQFRSELSNAVSDDVLLAEHVDVNAVSRTRRIPAGENVRSTMERVVRYNKIMYHHQPLACVGSFLASTVLVAACLLFPVVTLALGLGMCGVYAAFGIRRVSALFVVPAIGATLPLRAYSFLTDTIVWGGRRYAYTDKFDVEALGRR